MIIYFIIGLLFNFGLMVSMEDKYPTEDKPLNFFATLIFMALIWPLMLGFIMAELYKGTIK